MTPRRRCLRCWRPATCCYCAALAPVPTATRVVFLQHPRERSTAMGTARLARLALANAELHVGVRFEDHPRVRAIAAEATTVLLFPDGPDGPPPPSPPRTLVVVDGTWTTARKIVDRNPLLARLPRLRIVPPAPSAYRIRREPAPHCLSTVEAVAAALAALEGGPEPFAPMLAAFHAFVERQIAIATARRAPYRHGRPRAAAGRGAALARAVVVHVEGNPGAGGHELVLVAAERVATGERFEVVAAPRRALHPRFARHTGIAEARVLAGASMADLRSRWRAFLRPDDVLVGWGAFGAGLLAAEAMPAAPWYDLRPDVARRLGGRPGGAEHAAALSGAAPDPVDSERPARIVAALAALVRVLAASRFDLAADSRG